MFPIPSADKIGLVGPTFMYLMLADSFLTSLKILPNVSPWINHTPEKVCSIQNLSTVIFFVCMIGWDDIPSISASNRISTNIKPFIVLYRMVNE